MVLAVIAKTLLFKIFCLPFAGSILTAAGSSSLIDSIGLLESDSSTQVCKGFRVLVMPFREVPGALIIEALLGLMDEGLVEHLEENAYFQFFIGMNYPNLALFDI